MIGPSTEMNAAQRSECTDKTSAQGRQEATTIIAKCEGLGNAQHNRTVRNQKE